MVEFIELLFLTSLWMWGFQGFFDLSGLADSVDETKMPTWIKKPLFACPPCMSSFHGTISFLMFHNNLHLLLWPIFVFCLCGLNYIIKEHLYES